MKNKKKFIVMIILPLMFFSSCKDTMVTNEPITSGTKVYYVQKIADTPTNGSKPEYFNVIEFDIISKNKNVIKEHSMICSNMINNQIVCFNSDSTISLFNIGTKANTTLLSNYKLSYPPTFLITNTSKILYFEPQESNGGTSFLHIYLGNKNNIKERLLSDNMRLESIPDLYYNDSKLVYGVNNFQTDNDSMFTIDLNTYDVKYIKDSVRVYPDYSRNFSGSSIEPLIASITLEKEMVPGITQLFTINSETKEIKYLTNSLSSKGLPIFSDDGSQIAFAEVYPESTDCSINIINKNGSNISNLITFSQDKEIIYSMHWADKSHLIYTLVSKSSDFATETYLINVKTKQNELVSINSLIIAW